MSTEIQVWDVGDERIVPVEEPSEGTALLERDLEDWVVQRPDILGEDLLVIDRQRSIEGVGRIDVLCVDSTWQLVIVELKRSMAPRLAIAQALDYAAWLNSTSKETIHSYAAEYLKGQSLEDAFVEHFGDDAEIEPVDPKNHRILIVATSLDSSAERIINYLSERHKIDINAIFFRHVRLKTGERLLIRSVLVSEDVQKERTGGPKLTENQLLSIAQNLGTVDLVSELRNVRQFWREQVISGYGGSFRYFCRVPSGKERVICGFNVGGERFGAETGELGVWVRFRSAAELLTTNEDTVIKSFSGYEVVKTVKNSLVVRVRNREEASRLYGVFKKWAGFREDRPAGAA